MTDLKKSLKFVSIDGVQFVSGLFWQIAPAGKERDIEYIRELAEADGDEFYVLKEGEACHGFAQDHPDLGRGKVYSLAAAIVKSMQVKHEVQGTWMAAVSMGSDQYAFVSVREDVIEPNGDWLGSLPEVLAMMDRALAEASPGVAIYGPEELRYEQLIGPLSIREVLPLTSKGKVKPHGWWALKPIYGGAVSLPRFRIIIATMLLASLAGGVWYWNKLRVQKMQEEASAIEQMALLQSGASAPGAMPVRPPHPWPSEPMPLDLLTACERIVSEDDRVYVSGWELQSVDCNKDRAIYTYKRTEGNVTWLLDAQPKALISQDGNGATLDVPVQAHPSGRDEEVMSGVQATTAFWKIIQSVAVGAEKFNERAMPTPPQPLPGDKTQPKVLPPDWREFEFSIKTNSLPVLAGLWPIPGLRLNSVTYQFEGERSISLKGILYAK